MYIAVVSLHIAILLHGLEGLATQQMALSALRLSLSCLGRAGNLNPVSLSHSPLPD